jgi:superfamily I DNA/RNA helicase
VFLFGIAFLLLASAAKAQTPSASAFAKACQERLQDVQEDRRICVVGMVRAEKTIEVVFSTRDDFVGKKLFVYSSRVVERGLTPLKELSNLKDKIVVIGGFNDGSGIYSARLLSGDTARR